MTLVVTFPSGGSISQPLIDADPNLVRYKVTALANAMDPEHLAVAVWTCQP